MTQTTDPIVEQIRTWLAEQPCATCVDTDGYWPVHFQSIDFGACFDCREGEKQQSTGRAFSWASDVCPACRGTSFAAGNPCAPVLEGGCGSSGRVPKEVGLEELHVVLRNLGQGVRIEYRSLATGRIDCLVSDALHADYITTGIGDTDTEAALRAVAAKAGMR